MITMISGELMDNGEGVSAEIEFKGSRATYTVHSLNSGFFQTDIPTYDALGKKYRVTVTGYRRVKPSRVKFYSNDASNVFTFKV